MSTSNATALPEMRVSALRQTLASFAGVLFEPDDWVEARRIRPRREPDSRRNSYPLFRRASELPSLAFAKWAMKANGEGWGLFAGVNPRPHKGAKDNASIVLARTVFVDFDGGVNPDLVRSRIEHAELPPATMLVVSGGGVHAYWRLAEPLLDMRSWRARQKGLIDALDSDGVIHDPARVMRLPGLANTKYDPPRPTGIVECAPDRVYPVATFAELADCNPTGDEKSANSGHFPFSLKTSGISEISSSNFANILAIPGVSACIQRHRLAKPGTRHRKLFDMAKELKASPLLPRDPWDHEQIVNEFIRQNRSMMKLKDPEQNLLEYVDAWERVNSPGADGGLAEMYDRAKRSRPPTWAERYHRRGKLVASMVAELYANRMRQWRRLQASERRGQRIPKGQAEQGECIVLAQTRLAEAMGMPQTVVSHWLTKFIRDGHLRVEREYSREKGRARVYRYMRAGDGAQIAEADAEHLRRLHHEEATR
jgi:DNA-binding MarR family transcriptional regulator